MILEGTVIEALKPIHFTIRFPKDHWVRAFVDKYWYDLSPMEGIMSDESIKVEGEILNLALYNAAREVLTNSRMSDPTYSYLLHKSGRQEAQRIQQIWMNSERAKNVNGRKWTDTDSRAGGNDDGGGTSAGSVDRGTDSVGDGVVSTD